MIGVAGVGRRGTRAQYLDRGLAGLGLAGLVLGVAAEWQFARSGASPVDVGRDLAIGWLLLGGGLLAWRRWPDNACCRLVAAEGLAWFLPNLRGSTDVAVFTLGTVLAPLSDMILVHLVFAFPSGRLHGVWRRRAVLAGYGCALAVGAAFALVDSPAADWSSPTCSSCRVYALLLYPRPTALWGLVLLGVVAGAAALGTVLLTIRTWAISTAAARRISAARWVAWALCAVMVVADGAHNLPLALSAAGWAALDWLGDLSQLAIPLALGFGVARLHAAGGALGDLLAELDRRVSHSRLAETLARTLGDPSLQLLFWRTESAGYVDAQGGPAVLPAGEDGRVTRVVSGSGQPLAAIVHDRALADLPRLVGAARAATRLGLENERLRTELEAQLREVRESRQRIIEATDAARRQAERDLHDGAQQRLLSLGLHLHRLESQLQREGGPAAAVAEARLQLGTALEELRELARGIHPAILTQAGLAAALSSLAERAPIDVRVAVRCGRCRPSVEMTVYLVASEGLANVARHARASRASVCVDQRDGGLVVEIADDGVGGADLERGSGLRGLVDRVAAHGGALWVHSPPGGGTRISAGLPCE